MYATLKNKKIAICIALIAVILLCLLCSFFAIVNAETAQDYSVKVIHVSDLHYYPTYMCYKQSNADYQNSAMVKKGLLESKLVLESSAVLKKLFDDILAMCVQSSDGSANNAPDYLLVTGDLSSDGERNALIDIANTLRDLQNKVRAKGKPQFQVFVIPGNHDISNENATDYSYVEGAQTQSVTRYEFAKIFAGLGFPNMSEQEADKFYADDLLDDENLKFLPYDSTGGRYIYSVNSSVIDFEYLANFSVDKDLKNGDLTYVAKCPNETTFLAIDGVSASEVGGKVQGKVFDWISSKKSNGESILTGKNLISLTHHNVLPHFTMQEQWTKHYLYENWEEVRDFLLAKKVKYNFSGHMHANDVATYCNYDGFNLYDLETGSPVGCGAAYREAKITFFANGDSDMFQTPRTIKNVNVKNLIQDGYLTVGQNVDYDIVPNKDGVIGNLAGYIEERLYDSMLYGVLDSAIQLINKENFADKLLELCQNKFADSELFNKIFADNRDALRIVLCNLYDQIQSKTLINFEYSGDKEFLQSPENKLRAYVYSFAQSVIDIEIADGYTVQNMVVDAYTTHLYGGEGKTLSGANGNLNKGIEWMQSGDFVRAIVGKINDKNTGIVTLLKNMLNDTYNLTASLSQDQVRTLNVILSRYTCKLEGFNLETFIKNLANDKLDGSASGVIDDKINYLLQESIAKGVGENVCNIVRSLVTDVSDDSIVDIEIKVRYDEKNDDRSHYANGKKRSASIEDGRLPSMLTITFGENKVSDRNFVWFTDKSVTATDFQICEGDRTTFFQNTASRQTYHGACDIYAVDYTLADLGIASTYTTKEIARHTFNLKNLKPNTVYSYRVGDVQRNWMSDVYTFKTGFGGQKAPFEVLITTDVQGTSKLTYQNNAKLLNAANSVATIGYDFMLNLGDMVESGRNNNQWRDLLDCGRASYSTLPQVIAPGNHDMGTFAVSEGYIPKDGVVSDGYSPLDLHFDIGDKMYYSFDYSGVHFVVIDTNDIVNDNLSYTQLEWLTNDLKQNKDNPVVVAMHKGIYSAGPHRNDKEIVNMRNQLSGLFSEYKVELVLQGHDHIYSESYFLDGEGKRTKTPVYKQGSPINNNNSGVLYVTMGSGGDKFYDFDQSTDDFINKGKMFHTPRLKNPTFGKIIFDGKDIKFYSYEYDLSKDSIEQLKLFTNNSIILIVSVVTAIVIVSGIIILVFVLLRNHKKKMENCKKEWQDCE